MALTNDTLKAFKILYCEYKRRRKAGFTKPDSIKFNSGSIPKLPAFSDWLEPDIDCAIDELKAAKYIKDDIIGNTKLTNEGISYMENQPKEFFGDLSKLFDIVGIFL